MSDVLVRGILNGEVAVCACDVTAMVEQARTIHNTLPVGTIALGRTLAAGTMLSSMLKSEHDKFTLMVNGGGPAGTIMVTGNEALEMKAYIANPFVNPPPNEKGGFNIAEAVGKEGFITVIRDYGLKEPYVGKTEMVSGEIGEDIANYLLVSEQQPSVVYVHTWLEEDMSVVSAGGVIVRPLPNCSEETLQQIETHYGDIYNYSVYLLPSNVRDVLKKIFCDMELTFLDEQHPVWRCDCNKERLTEVVASLGRQEIEDMIKQDQGAEITCRFCNKEYRFSAEELQKLLEQ
ncbi:MAG: Hsp33 family molecular chaperone HslO [Christensenellaceae bacterium]|jgi:molecular chaperone Hsp33